jgi:hypothetical protein
MNKMITQEGLRDELKVVNYKNEFGVKKRFDLVGGYASSFKLQASRYSSCTRLIIYIYNVTSIYLISISGVITINFIQTLN